MENPSPPGCVVLYRWRLKSGMEERFIEAWSQVTADLRGAGSLGSRLHRGPDGLWYGYAQWPSAAARQRAFEHSVASPWRDAMDAAIEASLPEIILEPVADYLVLPEAGGQHRDGGRARS